MAVAKSLGMLETEEAGRGAVGMIWRKWDLLRNSEGLEREVVRDGVKNSPGKQGEVP